MTSPRFFLTLLSGLVVMLLVGSTPSGADSSDQTDGLYGDELATSLGLTRQPTGQALSDGCYAFAEVAGHSGYCLDEVTSDEEAAWVLWRRLNDQEPTTAEIELHRLRGEAASLSPDSESPEAARIWERMRELETELGLDST